MGEEHHIRRTSGVPPLMVVVSVILLYFTASLSALEKNPTNLDLFEGFSCKHYLIGLLIVTSIVSGCGLASFVSPPASF